MGDEVLTPQERVWPDEIRNTLRLLSIDQREKFIHGLLITLSEEAPIVASALNTIEGRGLWSELYFAVEIEMGRT